MPRWTLISGLRLSFEDKKAIWKRIFDSDTHVIFTQALNWREFQMRDEKSEFDVVPKVAMNWKPTDGLSLFASWTKGVKGGGFNDTASGPSPPERVFDKEKVTQWEVHSRWMLLGGLANTNLTLYRMDLEDFQLITSRPQDLIQVVENVGLLRAQGVEADFTYLPTDWLTVIGTLGFNDTEFVDFPFGPCPQSMPDMDGDGDPRCDFSGRPLMGAPKWNTTLTPAVSFPLTLIPGLQGRLPFSLDGIGLTSRLTWSYTDVTYIGNNPLDGRVRRDPFFLLKGSLGIFDLGQGWSFTLHAENITNEIVSLARLEISGLADNFVDAPEPPRTLFGQFRYQF